MTGKELFDSVENVKVNVFPYCFRREWKHVPEFEQWYWHEWAAKLNNA